MTMSKFIIGYRDSNDEFLTEFNDKKEADFEAEEWCEVEANDLEEAKLKYEECFLAWHEATK